MAAQAQLWIHAGMRSVSGLGCACVHSLTGTTHALCSLMQCGCAPRVRRCAVPSMWCCAGLGWLAVWSRCLCARRDCEARRLCDRNPLHTEATGLTAWAHQGAGWCWVHMHACGRVCKGMEGVMAHGMGWAVLGQACSLCTKTLEWGGAVGHGAGRHGEVGWIARCVVWGLQTRHVLGWTGSGLGMCSRAEDGVLQHADRDWVTGMVLLVHVCWV